MEYLSHGFWCHCGIYYTASTMIEPDIGICETNNINVALILICVKKKSIWKPTGIFNSDFSVFPNYENTNEVNNGRQEKHLLVVECVDYMFDTA